MRLTNLTHNHPWDLVLSKEDSQQPEIWEKLKELHCNEMPASTEQLESQLNEHGHILIRTGQPLNEDKIVELIGGRERLMNYKHGLNERKKVPDSIFS